MFCSHRLTRASCVAILWAIVGVIPVQANAPKQNLQAPPKSGVQNKQATPSPDKQVKVIRQTSGKSTLHVILDELFGRFKQARPTVNGTTRSRWGDVCAIAPGLLEKKNRIVSDRPLFVWQGEVDTIKVFDDETGQLLWQGSIAPQTTMARYDGTPLEPGRYYIWSLERDNQVLTRHFFEVMSAAERRQLLAQKHDGMNENPGASADLIEANYFSKLALWSDMFTALNSERQPMLEAALHQDICSDTPQLESSLS